jgi:hypothetical protein
MNFLSRYSVHVAVLVEVSDDVDVDAPQTELVAENIAREKLTAVLEPLAKSSHFVLGRVHHDSLVLVE